MEKNIFKACNRANPNLMDYNLDNIDNDFKYLFPTSLFLVYRVDWKETNNLLAIIDKSQQCKELLNDSMSIPNNLLAEIAMQDIIYINSIEATQISFNILFNMESIANFYIISSSSTLACHYFKKYKN